MIDKPNKLAVRLLDYSYNTLFLQLTVVGVSTEIGQTVLQNVGVEPKPGQGLVLTLLQHLVVWIVLDLLLRV